MAKEKFRRQLKQEAEKWQEEGLISVEVFQQIADRYEFQNLTTSSQVFSTILYCLGGILIGLAVITFVAANWQYLDKISKVILLFGWLIGINTLGFYLLQRYQRLGQSLLLLGGLSLGAVIALFSQIFNLSGGVYGLFLIWGIGVIPMGASLRFQALTMMGLILLTIGYSIYTVAYIKGFNLIAISMPYLSIGLLTLAYWLESRAVFVLVVLLWITSVAEVVWDIFRPISLVLPAIILWGYNNSLKLDRLGSYISQKAMEPVGRAISIILGAITLYSYSFRFNWGESFSLEKIDGQFFYQLYFGLIVGISFYVVVAEFLSRNDVLGKIFLGIISIFTLLKLFNPEPLVGIFIANCLLAVLSIGLIRIGIEKALRRNFWFGIILLCLQIMSRTFEYNTGLLLKAFVLALCGIAILALGIWFESYLQNLSTEENL